jgi:tetratricopeptide (TPR) repeat protein
MNILKLHGRMLSLILLINICMIAICLSEERPVELILPTENIQYSEYNDTDLIQIAEMLRQVDRQKEAVEAYQKALSRNLTESQKASVRHILALAYESTTDHGQDAKNTYAQIINEQPNYEKLPEVAYRLGELNYAIIPLGTKPDSKKAIECLKLVIRLLPVEPNKGNPANIPEVTYLSLEAHMMLGNIYLGDGLCEEAGKCFKTIFDCDINKTASLSYEKFRNDKEKQEHMEGLKKRIAKMKERVPDKMVRACISSDIGESMQRLSKLQSEYPDNAQIRELVSKELDKINGIEDIIKRQIDNSNID